MQILTLPQRRAREQGLSARDLARKMTCGKRLTARQLDNRATTVARVLKQGNCGALYARRLGHALGIEGAWLELPCQCWPAHWQPAQSAVETPKPPRGGSLAAAEVYSAEGARCNARLPILPVADPERVQILRLVP